MIYCFFSLVFFAIGFVFGWGARSFGFVKDQDCANPEHKDKEGGNNMNTWQP
jgi:hypothetical protein